MVRKTGVQCVDHAEVIPGRLLHVRVTRTHGGCIDCLNIYQHAMSKDASLMSRRSSVWKEVARTLDRVPLRNVLVLAGDFNTPRAPFRGHCGPGVLHKDTDPPEDVADFTNILESYDLCILNSWQTNRPSAAFEFNRFQSQIDHIIVRRLHADWKARLSYPIADFGPLAHRNGARHHPIYASIPDKKRPWHGHAPVLKAHVDNDAIVRDLQAEREPARLVAFRSEVACNFSMIADVKEMGSILHNAALRHYPIQSRAPKLEMWKTPEVHKAVMTKWRAFRYMRSFADHTLASLFGAWRAWLHFQQTSVRARHASANNRRKKVQDELEIAAEAANRHDHRTLFQVIRRLAPKQAYKPTRLRARGGHLMDPQEESKAFEKHFRARFNTQDSVEVALHERQWTLQQEVQISEAELGEALWNLPARKAGPKMEGSSASWKAAAWEVARVVTPHLEHLWAPGCLSIPHTWTDSHLCFLLKPQKAGTDAAHFRPIGLLNHLGKAVLGILARRIGPKITHYVEQIPQFGFVAKRNIKHALRRAFNHCQEVRQLCAGASCSIQDRQAGRSPPACVGGLMVCADLAQAFDRVPRSKLMEAMSDADFSEDEISIFMQWHTQNSCLFEHRHCSHKFNTTQGVRQGCKAAPGLFVLFSGLMLKKAGQKLGSGWVKRVVTAYADDHLLHWVFKSMTSLERAVDELSFFWGLLKSMNMQIHPDKCTVIFTYRGTLKETVRDRFTRVTSTGRVFRFRHRGSLIEIPMQTQADYLGTVISYGSFEDLTLDRRIQKANQAYWRLHRILNSKRALSLRCRLRLRSTVIWSTLSFGLDCCGLTRAGQRKLQSLCMKHIRACTASPSHIFRVTDEELLQRHGLQRPLDILIKVMASENTPASNLDTDQDKLWRSQVRLSLQPNTSTLAEANPEQQVPCHICGLYFASRKAVLVHQSRTHGLQTQKQEFDQYKHSVGGQPRCAQCGKSFAAWKSLKRHVELRRCGELAHPDPDSLEATADGLVSGKNPPQTSATTSQTGGQKLDPGAASDTQAGDSDAHCIAPNDIVRIVRDALVAKSSPNGVYELAPHIRQRMRQECCQCGQWVASTFMMKNHYRNSHPQLWQQHSAQVGKQCSGYVSVGSPCILCGSSSSGKKHMPRCTVLFQFCMTRLAQAIPGHGRSDRGVLWTPGFVAESDGKEGHGTEPSTTKDSKIGERQGRRQAEEEGKVTSGHGSGHERGIDPDPGRQANPKTRGQRTHPSRQSCLGPLHGQHAGKPPTEIPVRRSQQMEERASEGGSSWETAAQSSTVSDHNACHEQGARSGGFRQSAAREGGEQRVAKPGTMAVPAMECGTQGAANGHQPKAIGARQGKACSATDEGHGRPGGCGAQTTLHQAFKRSDAEQHGRLPSGNRNPVNRGDRCLPSFGSFYGASTAPNPTQEGYQSEANTSGATSSGDARILSVALINPHNVCYVNTVVLSIAWTFSLINHVWVRLMGYAAPAVTALLQSTGPFSIASNFLWRSLLHAWRDIARQQDAAEFMQHLIHAGGLVPMKGRWEARCIEDDVCRALDSGTTDFITMAIPIMEGACIQQIVNAWSSQHYLHALTFIPQVLVVRLDRFRNAAGQLHKDSTSVMPRRDISVPLFTGDGLICEWVGFRLSAMILHHGVGPHSGRYTAALIPGDDGVWLTDDSRPATHHAELPEQAKRNIYLLLFRRVAI